MSVDVLRRAVVTGGAGFVGSHLCRRLLALGYEVVCLDNFLTGSSANVDDLQTSPAFRLIEHDVRLPLPVTGHVSHVFHLASPASPPAYLAHPVHTLEVGSQGTRHALDLAQRHGAVFLLASTSEIYGDPEVHPQPETYWGNVSSTGPRSVYDESKRYAEALASAFARTYATKVRIARIFNTYGPDMAPEDGRALPNFIMQALTGRPLTLYGDGTQTRSFCHVDDTVAGLLALATSGVDVPVNLGNPDEHSLLEMAELVLRLTGSDSVIEKHDLPQDDPKVRCPDITRARTLLGWEPRIPLSEGLPDTIAWFRTQLPVELSSVS
jgi:dTDP-glucose 4,6-dehydratase